MRRAPLVAGPRCCRLPHGPKTRVASDDSSEHGRIAWARVKGATENALMRLFKGAYMFRPAELRVLDRG